MAIKTEEFEAIVYGWRNIIDGKMYIGFHKTTEIYDGYINSSKDEELTEAWSYGSLERFILWTGSVSECITLENFALKYAKRELNWNMFYNQSVGGGVGIVSFDTLTDEMEFAVVDFMNGHNPVEPEVDLFEATDRDLIKEVVKGIKNGKYKHVKSSVDNVVTFKRNQVRLNMILEEKVAQIADRMSEDPKKARKQIEPVVVLIMDGENIIIDGNHTINASKRAGWSSVDVVYINFSDFGFNFANVDSFGYLMNHDEKVKTLNSKEDCRRAIVKLYNQIKLRDETVDIESGKFKNTCLETYKGLWTAKTIVGNLNSAIKQVRNDEANASRNFKIWDKKELISMTEKSKSKNPGHTIVRISSEKSFNAGFGGVVHKMVSDGLKEGKLLIHHNNIHDYDNWSIAEDKLKGAISALSADYNITYEVLDAFEK
jgi:hypothetical protein